MKNQTILKKQKDMLLIEAHPQPDWDDFIEWGKAYLDKTGLGAPIDISIGADRHMLVFTFNRARFSLNYENYSESIWITGEESLADQQFEALLERLGSIDKNV